MSKNYKVQVQFSTKVVKLMLDQTSKRSIFLFIKTVHSARSN